MVAVALVALAQVQPVHLEDGREVPGADEVVLDVQHAGGGQGQTAVMLGRAANRAAVAAVRLQSEHRQELLDALATTQNY